MDRAIEEKRQAEERERLERSVAHLKGLYRREMERVKELESDQKRDRERVRNIQASLQELHDHLYGMDESAKGLRGRLSNLLTRYVICRRV